MNEEKRSICDAIFSAIQDDIRNLCDTEIFTQSTFMELGEFFYGKLINSVEGATVDSINTVVSVLTRILIKQNRMNTMRIYVRY